MFTIHIDDSGTDPNQAVAIASGLIIPGARILSLATEWDKLKTQEEFSCWHTSECIANWAEPKRSRVFRRVRAMAKKYGVKAISFAIYKKDYDEAVPLELRAYSGKFHYSWAHTSSTCRISGVEIKQQCSISPRIHFRLDEKEGPTPD